LTVWTEKAGPPSLHQPLYLTGATIAQTGLIGTVVNGECVLKITQLAIGLTIVLKR